MVKDDVKDFIIKLKATGYRKHKSYKTGPFLMREKTIIFKKLNHFVIFDCDIYIHLILCPKIKLLRRTVSDIIREKTDKILYENKIFGTEYLVEFNFVGRVISEMDKIIKRNSNLKYLISQ